jgi:hypothetical protein
MAAPKYRFTSYDLDFSIRAAKAIWDARGDSPISADEFAVLLGYTSRNNGAFLTRLGNVKLFGLVEGPSTSLRVTELTRRILLADYPATAEAAKIEAFENVPLYKAVLERYEGQVLPNELGLKNSLVANFDIQEDKAAFVLTRLMDSAEQAGLFRVQGNRTKMVRPSLGAPPRPDPEVEPKPPAPAPPATASAGRHSKLIEGVLDELPDDRHAWDEDDIEQWLSLMGQALRLYYRAPKAAAPGGGNP